MADNVSINTGTGATIAADEVTDGVLGTVKVQIVKLWDGTDNGTTRAAVSANGLSVAVKEAPALTKSTQGTVGFSVQDLKDAGRSAKLITLDSFAVTSTSEVLNTISISTDLATVTTGTQYTVTTGKRFRVQSVSAMLHSVAGNTTYATVILRIRGITTGTLLVSSPIQAICALPAVNTANSSLGPVDVAFPDGWEIGPGAAIGITTTCAGFVATTAAPKVSVSIVGYEY